MAEPTDKEDGSGRQTPNPTARANAPVHEANVKTLTPEEQMALYEKELKETDWGHQPC